MALGVKFIATLLYCLAYILNKWRGIQQGGHKLDEEQMNNQIGSNNSDPRKKQDRNNNNNNNIDVMYLNGERISKLLEDKGDTLSETII